MPLRLETLRPKNISGGFLLRQRKYYLEQYGKKKLNVPKALRDLFSQSELVRCTPWSNISMRFLKHSYWK